MLLSKAFQALIASSILLLLTAHTEAHSYADCIDWCFNSKNKPWAIAKATAPIMPVASLWVPRNFAKLDPDDPNRHYQPGQQLSTARTSAVTRLVPTRGISDINPSKNPLQEYFNKIIIVRLGYKNCTKGGSTDAWLCGGCFKIPTSVKPGHHVLQWRWRLNKNEWYTSCADLDIKAK
ncbi:hypothetical protein BGZ82_007958 [Podila clonocystis]|nr:hypothetical protein BGZ82_007958 [Podila clonocystis]